MKTLYYRATEANGTTPFGNYFDTTLTTSGASDRTTLRSIYERDTRANEFRLLDSAYIVYNSKLIPPNNSNVSGITKNYRIQVFTINIDNDYIECEHHEFADTIITYNLSKTEFAVKSASGRFKNVKRVVVDYDNYNGNVLGNTNEPSEWNRAPSLVYNRRIKFYSS